MSTPAAAAFGGDDAARGIRVRRVVDLVFQGVALVVLLVTLAALAALIADVWQDGIGRLSWEFLTSFGSRRASHARAPDSPVTSGIVARTTDRSDVPHFWLAISPPTHGVGNGEV